MIRRDGIHLERIDLFGLVILAVLVCLPCSPQQLEHESLDSEGTLGQELQQKGHLGRIKPFLEVMDIPIDAPLTTEFLLGPNVGNVDVFDLALDTGTYLLTVTKSGILLKYGRLGVDDIPNTGKPMHDKSELVGLAEKLIATGVFDPDKVDGLEFDFDTVSILHAPDYRRNAENFDATDTTSGQWQFSVSRTYRGIECMSGLFLIVDIPSGLVTTIAHLPFFPPEYLEENISEAKAIDIASSAARRNGVYSETYDVSKRIVPLESYSRSASTPPEHFLCWVVTFDVSEPDGHRHPYSYYVDCKSGELKGQIY